MDRLPGHAEPQRDLCDRSAIQDLRTAWYLCSTTFNSKSIAGVSRIN